MGATDQCDTHPNAPHMGTLDTTDTTHQPTSQVKVKVACVGTSLSADEQAGYLCEGCCFSCGKTGHQRPECPDAKPRVQIVAVEPLASSQPVETLSTPSQSKN